MFHEIVVLFKYKKKVGENHTYTYTHARMCVHDAAHSLMWEKAFTWYKIINFFTIFFDVNAPNTKLPPFDGRWWGVGTEKYLRRDEIKPRIERTMKMEQNGGKEERGRYRLKDEGEEEEKWRIEKTWKDKKTKRKHDIEEREGGTEREVKEVYNVVRTL